MKLAARYDIDVPIGFVWAELADFETWERMAIRRGAEVMRTDTLSAPGPGMGWQISFPFRGQTRRATITLADLETPNRAEIQAKSSMADLGLVLTLMDLSPSRTRIELKTEIKPRSLPARLYVQGLRLARGKVERNHAQRLGQLALEIEDRFRRPAHLRR